MSNLATRLLFAAFAIPFFLFLAWWGFSGRMLILAIMGGVAAWEWANIVRTRLSGAPVAWISAAAALTFIVSQWFPQDWPDMRYLAAAWFLVYLGFALITVEVGNLLPWLALQMGGILYCGPWLMVSATLFDSRPGWYGAGIFLAVVMGIWANDSGAYFAGRATGKHKMAPLISPAKSWEGFAGGLLAALVVLPTLGRLLVPVWSVGEAMMVGLLVSLVGPAGDLLESALKRWAGVKDSSSIFPGHGGMLDRFDSYLLAAPVVALVLEWMGVL